MNTIKNKLVLLLVPFLFFFASCSENQASLEKSSPWAVTADDKGGEKATKKDDEEKPKKEEVEIKGSKTELCVLPGYTPKEPKLKEETTVEEPDREINDAATGFVTKYFFGTPETLYNFVKFVYTTIDNALADFRKKYGLDDRAVFLVFKGGNVLRITANGVFDLLPEGAKMLLKEKYSPFFKRSDADFSVYVDDKGLEKMGLDYEKTFTEINDLVFDELEKIREEFKANPTKYFSFFEPKNDRTGQLKKTIDEFNKMTSVTEKGNAKFHNAQFYQAQLLENRAQPELECPYEGKIDVLFKKIVKDMPQQTPLSKKPDWLYISDNRTIEFPLGSDPNKIIKFNLPRIKAALKAYFKQGGNYYSHQPVGELIDVSMPHRKSEPEGYPHRKSELENFFENYDKKVAKYTLFSADGKDQFTFKSYSHANLAEDLQFILFQGAERPWLGGPKYTKRLWRLFFFHVMEMMHHLGIGSSDLADYVKDLRETILVHLKGLYPLDDKADDIAKTVNDNVKKLIAQWPDLETSNDFWHTLSTFVTDRLVGKPLEDDQKEFENFIKIVEENLDVAEQLGRLTPPMKIDPSKAYDVLLRNLF